ncbi:MAG: hypothetical protein KBT11_04225 [Treponema sp.]|nr:hypothetical protein [Candidatus Treponema equifaecale]
MKKMTKFSLAGVFAVLFLFAFSACQMFTPSNKADVVITFSGNHTSARAAEETVESIGTADTTPKEEHTSTAGGISTGETTGTVETTETGDSTGTSTETSLNYKINVSGNIKSGKIEQNKATTVVISDLEAGSKISVSVEITNASGKLLYTGEQKNVTIHAGENNLSIKLTAVKEDEPTVDPEPENPEDPTPAEPIPEEPEDPETPEEPVEEEPKDPVYGSGEIGVGIAVPEIKIIADTEIEEGKILFTAVPVNAADEFNGETVFVWKIDGEDVAALEDEGLSVSGNELTITPDALTKIYFTDSTSLTIYCEASAEGEIKSAYCNYEF